MRSFVAPWWLPEGHSQTIVPALWGRRFVPHPMEWVRERWLAPDGDFIDVDRLKSGETPHTQAPLLVLFHGLEGSSASHYAKVFAVACSSLGWAMAVPHFRGCSGRLNRGPRAYHSGDHAEVDWVLKRFKAEGPAERPVFAVGVSLGGNALARWAGEHGSAASQVVQAVASVCSPLDLVASGHAICKGLNRLLYNRMFLATMRPKALRKWDQHPGLFDRNALARAKDLYEFDDVFTAPVHGFAGALDYWQRASAKPHLRAVQIPMLLLNARNDPFVPALSLPSAHEVSPSVVLWQPAHGGHVGFPSGLGVGLRGVPWLMDMPHAVLSWLKMHAE